MFAFVTQSDAVGKGPIFQNLQLFTVLGGDSSQVTSTPVDGFVKIGVVGQVGNLAFSGEINGLTPLTQYDVWARNLTGYTGPFIFDYPPLGYFKLTRFTTDALGKGTFGYTILSENLPSGTYPIQVAINTTSDTYGATVAATNIAAYDYIIAGTDVINPGCNKPGTTFVGNVPNPGDPTGPDWRLVMHGSYRLGKCDGTGAGEGDWNVQMIKGPDGAWEFYKNVFTEANLTDTGAFLYSDNHGNTYHPPYDDSGTIWWWIIKANGESPFMEPVQDGVFTPINALPNGFGFY